MEFVCYDHWDQLPHDAGEFFAVAGRESAFFSLPWLKNLTDNGLDEDQSAFLACVLDRDSLLALLPLTRRGGNHYYSLKHLYTSLSSLLICEDRQDQIIECLVGGLTLLPIDYLQIDPIAEDDPKLLLLQRALEASSYTCQRHYRFYNWFHRTEQQTFADYISSRPARVRNTIARKQRKLEREHGYRISLYTKNDLQKGMADYRSVYTASWKAEEQFIEFIDGLAARFAQQGWLRLAILYAGEAPAAAQFWFVAHGKASIFKLVYDQAWMRYSPGSILTAYLMRHVIDIDKVEEIDFLTGNDAYKQEWMSERRERIKLCCFPSKPQEGPGMRLLGPFAGLLNWLRRTVYT